MTVTLDEMGYEKLAHAIVLIFWVGGGFGALAFVKVKADEVRPCFVSAVDWSC